MVGGSDQKLAGRMLESGREIGAKSACEVGFVKAKPAVDAVPTAPRVTLS
jgi:hypothetical protein